MGRITDILTRAFLAGILALALALPTASMAQSSSSTVTTYTTTTSTIVYDPSNYDLTLRNGYASMADLEDSYGMWNPSLMHDRVMVLLTNDAFQDIKLSNANGFERGLADGYAVTPFDPQELIIPTGTTVTFWTNEGHHAIDPMDGNSFDRAIVLVPGETFSYTFNNPGLYRFQDSFYAGPSGQDLQGLIIRVKGAAKATALETTTTQTTQSTTQTQAVESTSTQTTQQSIHEETVQTQPQVQVQGQQTQVQTIKKTRIRNQEVK